MDYMERFDLDHDGVIEPMDWAYREDVLASEKASHDYDDNDENLFDDDLNLKD